MTVQSNQNVFKIYETLRSGLMYPSIVYFPKEKVLEYVEYKEIEELQKIMQPFDKLWICESLEINYYLEDNSNLLILLKKQDLLKNNLFDLIKYKKKLAIEQFAYLEKSYKQILYVCMYFSQEMVKYLSESENKDFSKFVNLFELQDFHYQNHFIAIEEVFPTSEEEKKTWYTKENIDFEKFNKNPSIDKNLKGKTPKRAKKKKQHYITDEESQKYLLERVFNLKIE